MYTKKQIALATAITLIASTSIILYNNFEMIDATYKLTKVEIKLSYWTKKQGHYEAKLSHSNERLSELHDKRGELDNARKDIATVYIAGNEAIAGGYIQFNDL